LALIGHCDAGEKGGEKGMAAGKKAL